MQLNFFDSSAPKVSDEIQEGVARFLEERNQWLIGDVHDYGDEVRALVNYNGALVVMAFTIKSHSDPTNPTIP